MKIAFFGPLREIVGKKEIEYQPIPKTVIKLLNELSHHYGRAFLEELFDESEALLKRRYLILVDGQNIYHLAGPETEITEDSEIKLLPVVAGG